MTIRNEATDFHGAICINANGLVIFIYLPLDVKIKLFGAGYSSKPLLIKIRRIYKSFNWFEMIIS